ncbi:MAG: hypothetical protein GYB35_04445 [Algicola sp.]|nr:hypothetical protein [Algicola sp.]
MKALRISLIGIFTLTAIGAFLSAVYLIWITAFGVGWSGKKTSLIEIIWMWKGVILITIYSIIASIGLARKNKIGIVFGYTIPFICLLYPIIDYSMFGSSSNDNITVYDLLITLIYLGLPTFVIFGITKLKKSVTQLKLAEYILILVLILCLFLSFKFI